MCKILVIDDEKVIINMIQQLLEMHGHDVDTAYDGGEGIQKFDNDCFNMVITDICMPGVDGNSVAKHIRNSDKKYVLPILYASLSVGSGALGYFSSLKLWNPETRKFVINSSKISATGYTLLGYSLASLSVAGFVASIIS